MVKIFIKGDRKDDLYNFFFNIFILIVVLGLSFGLGLIINNSYDKNSYDNGFYDGLTAFCGDLSVGIKEGVYVCYENFEQGLIIERGLIE